jgi:hypothetical protein
MVRGPNHFVVCHAVPAYRYHRNNSGPNSRRGLQSGFARGRNRILDMAARHPGLRVRTAKRVLERRD